MFYLYSSDHSPRYKKNVLDSLCYPDGHIFTYRYHKNHVSPEIHKWGEDNRKLEQKLKRLHCQQGIAIYAEKSEDSFSFNFFPLREIKVTRIRLEGSIYYIDIEYGRFIHYGSQQPERKDKLREWRKYIESTPFYPLPPSTKNASGVRTGRVWKQTGTIVPFDLVEKTSQGYFCSYNNASRLPISNQVGQSELAWESIVDLVSAAPSMRRSIFFLILGISQFRRRWWIIGPKIEKKIKPRSDSWTVKYPLPMGRSVVLMLLFFRSSEADRTILPQSLSINLPENAFAGASQRKIIVSSRYNRERIEIVCNRVFDSVLSPITIERIPHAAEKDKEDDSDEEILCPTPFLLTFVKVNKRTLAVILLSLLVAPLCVSMGPDSVKLLADVIQPLSPHGSNVMSNHPGPVAAFFKVTGTGIALLGGYLGFRRLPVGK